jgi:hypothetical protein
MLNATGVPSVIMNYINEADYAKTLVMANAKYVGRVVSLQANFNGGTTEFYKKVMSMATPIPKEIIAKFVYKYSPPKNLNSVNINDVVNNTDQVVTYMADNMMGKNSDPGDDGNIIKDIFTKKLAREYLTMLPWDKAEELMQESKVELQKRKMEKASTATNTTPDEGV